jgi:hypothetical protein
VTRYDHRNLLSFGALALEYRAYFYTMICMRFCAGKFRSGPHAGDVELGAKGQQHGVNMISRRGLLQGSAATMGALLVTPNTSLQPSQEAASKEQIGRLPRGMYVGLELPSEVPMPSSVVDGLQDIGVNYVNFYTAASIGDYYTVENIPANRQQTVAEAMVKLCEHTDFAFSPSVHWKDIPDPTLAFYGRHPSCLGVVMDEGEHVRQLNWRGYGQKFGIPPWAKVNGLSLPEAYEAVLEGLRKTREHYKSFGLDTLVTCVWPVMLHTIARAQIGVACKVQGLSYAPVSVAIALGAAKQYNTPFWICLEMWSQCGGTALPGHSPEEFRSNLLFAYWVGVDHIYIEGAGWNAQPAGNQGVPFNLVSYQSGQRYRLTEYGRILRWFCREYIPGHPRDYTFRDVAPEIVIVRFPDTCWGQRYSGWPDNLYGARNLHSDAATEAWFKIWNLLTFGVTGDDGITYCKYRIGKQLLPANPDYSPVAGNVRLHTFFSPLNNIVVYDHRASETLLEPAKLIFLAGVEISPETLKAVANRVRAGATCVALPSLIHRLSLHETTSRGTAVVPSGKGRWVITNDFDSPEVLAEVKPFLGDAREIRYRFGKREIRFRRPTDDFNRIEVQV